MKGQKQNVLIIEYFEKLYKQENSIIFQKPIQISPPSTPEEIYTIQPKTIRNTLNKRITNMEINTSKQQRNHHENNNVNLPNFPKSISPKRLGEQYVSPLKLMRNTQDSIDSPISIRLPNRRATKLCTKVLQKYKNKYFI